MPTEFQLDPAFLDALGEQLARLGWPGADSLLRAERIGDGNMNLTVRIHTKAGSFILKQAVPWVAKYPHIPAPVERAEVEAEFYRVIATTPAVSGHMPRILGHDPSLHLLCLQDLGELGDCGDAYGGAAISAEMAISLTAYLAALHQVSSPAIPNRAMRMLNHEHQYRFPLRPDNGMDLDRITPGLAGLAADLKADAAFCSAVEGLGEQYLTDGGTLLHGDFFPGSWLRTANGVAVIDPEFCFTGEPEYDLGVFLAHLELAAAGALWSVVERAYPGSVDWLQARRFAGAEIMRRLIGVAQLPLPVGLDVKSRWLRLSRELVCGS